MTIAVFGSINMDVTAYLDRLPLPGETLHGHEYKLGLGGKGANQAVAARKLGSDVRFICRLGADDFAKPAVRELSGYGVDLGLVRQDPGGATGIAIINVGQGGENYISLIGGSNLAMDDSDVARGGEALATAKVLLLQLEVPIAASLKAAAATRAGGGLVVLDPAPVPKDGLPEAVLHSVDVITPNEVEAGLMLGWRPESLEDGLKAARQLCRRGVPTAIVKLGAKGLAVAGPGGEATIAAFKVVAIDTVAAGDTFNGALANALERGLPMLEAARFAAACGALSTTRKGAAAAAPTRDEVDAFLNTA